VEASVAYFRGLEARFRDFPAEIVVVDDGSTDGTWGAICEFAAGKELYRLIHRPSGSNAGCARNEGAAASSGSLLFFLDGDDLFFPEHVSLCFQALEKTGKDYDKPGMHFADPLHPHWKRVIENSSVINLCLRRSCHFAFGGFPDYHLCLRQGGRFIHLVDVFRRMGEDINYNRLLDGMFSGCRVERDTVEYVRYPGNSLDRQYEKFCRPPREHKEKVAEDDLFRIRLGELIVQYHLQGLKKGQDIWDLGRPSASRVISHLSPKNTES
jgi:glycosyltransferase involved in cell wall biosynthesis